MTEPYKLEVTPLSPVAIREGQTEVHAPGHDTWDQIACPQCSDIFLLGPNRIFGSRITKQEATKHLLQRLVDDHTQHRNHENSYELPD
ncbi:MAG TPA: hypothetical protein VFA89_21130 [Terriglobales bacterium]|nr:hypothetical protein [Terriglobales bacterium]